MINVKILLSLDNAPEKYKVSPDLAKLLDIHTETKPTIIIALWQYIKANKLQDQMDKRMITCDEGTQLISPYKYLKHWRGSLAHKDYCFLKYQSY